MRRRIDGSATPRKARGSRSQSSRSTSPAVDSSKHHQLVSRNDRYALVEKIGDAGRIVEDLNPRKRADEDTA